MIRPATALMLLTSALWSAAEAKQVPICTDWDLTGKWYGQTNGYDVIFQIVQTGTQLSGDAWYTAKNNSDGRHGSLEGHLNGNLFVIVAHWDGAGAGEYSGSIAPNGLIGGDTTDLSNTSSRARWSADYRYPAKCKVAAAAPAPAPATGGLPVKKLGKPENSGYARPARRADGNRDQGCRGLRCAERHRQQDRRPQGPQQGAAGGACENNWCSRPRRRRCPKATVGLNYGPDYDLLHF